MRAVTLCAVAILAACLPTDVFAESDLRVAIVETQDEFTEVRGLSDFLQARQVAYEDLSEAFDEGRAPELSDVDLVIIGSFVTSDKEQLATYEQSADSLRKFVARGGVVAVLGQADQHAPNETWMPSPRRIRRTDQDFDVAHLSQPGHPLLNAKAELTEGERRGWRTPTGWRGSNTLWESFSDWNEAAVVLGGTNMNPPQAAGLIEMGWGQGRAVFYAMTPDKAFVTGNEPARQGGAKLLENLLAYAAVVKAGDAPAIKLTPPAGYKHAVQGTVYRDENGNGRRDSGEAGLGGVAVSDGLEVVRTNSRGDYRLSNEGKDAVFVFLHQNGEMKQDGQGFFQRLPNDSTGDERYDFGVRLEEAKTGKKSGSIRFVQLTDSHIRSVADREYMIQATNEIYEMSPPPDFVVATGDLVDWGVDEHFQNYVAGMQKPPVPYFNVFGNHEIYMGPIERYHQYIGPDYYSFERGGVVFLSLNCVRPGRRQDAWLKQTLELLGEGRPVVVFQHYPPTVGETERFAGLGVKSVFSGHWHSEKEMEHAGVQNINSPTFVMGGIDASPAGFKVVELKPDGSAETEWRYGFQDKRLTIVSPQKGAPVDHSYFPIVVNAYDTSDDVVAVTWRLGSSGSTAAGGELKRESALSWTGKAGSSHRKPHGHDHAHEHEHPHPHGHHHEHEHQHEQDVAAESSPLKTGSYPIEVTARDQRGATWSARQQVELIDGAPAKPVPGREWPMFMGNAAHTGDAGESIGKLPLRMAWSIDTGGDPDFAAPIYADGRIYLALKKRTRGRTNGVAAFDPATGERQWLFETPMAINHTPAFAEGVLCVAEMGGRVYGVSAKEGQELWHFDLLDARGRFCYCAPAVHDGWFYAGVMRRMAKLRPVDGKVEWDKQIGGDADWISSYGSPAVGDGQFVMCGNMSRGPSLVVATTSAAESVWQSGADGGLLASPSLAGNRVLFVTTNSNLYCHDLSSGARHWTARLGGEGGDGGWSATTPAVRMDDAGEGIIVAGSGDGHMHGVNLADGAVLWTHVSDESIFKVSPYRRDSRPLVASATIAGDHAYFGSADGHLYCVELKTGKEVWKYVIGAPVMSTPLITGNVLYVAAYDGRLYAFTSAE